MGAEHRDEEGTEGSEQPGPELLLGMILLQLRAGVTLLITALLSSRSSPVLPKALPVPSLNMASTLLESSFKVTKDFGMKQQRTRTTSGVLLSSHAVLILQLMFYTPRSILLLIL